MPNPDPQTCEVKIGSAWLPMDAAKAHALHRSAQKRCPSCHGQVMTTSSYVSPIRIRVNHRKSHSGCPLKPDTYSGTPSLHPQALT
jgi:hypothetical protein